MISTFANLFQRLKMFLYNVTRGVIQYHTVLQTVFVGGGHARSMWKVPGQRQNLNHSCNQEPQQCQCQILNHQASRELLIFMVLISSLNLRYTLQISEAVFNMMDCKELEKTPRYYFFMVTPISQRQPKHSGEYSGDSFAYLK